MKGFKKDGKFRPTGKRNKSSLKKSDIRTGGGVAGVTAWCKSGKHNYTVMKHDGNESCVNHRGKQSLDSPNRFTMEDYDANLSALESTNGGEIRNALALAKKYGTKSEVADMESMLSGYESTGNTYNFEYDEMNRIDSKYYHQFKADQEKSRDKHSLDESDSGEIPPEHIYDKSMLSKKDGRLFLVNDDSMGNVAVDEYEKGKDGYDLVRNIMFAQGEDGQMLIEDSGAKDSEIDFLDEDKILDYLDGAGSLQLSNFGDRDKKTLDESDVAKEKELTNYLQHARTQEIPISSKETELYNLRKKLGMNPTWGED